MSRGGGETIQLVKKGGHSKEKCVTLLLHLLPVIAERYLGKE